MIIRRLTYWDYPRLKKLVSYLGTDDNNEFSKSLAEAPLWFVNALMPLNFKFNPESFILLEDNEILGLITVSVTGGNCNKVNITRLIFKENNYDIGKRLVEFVISKYGAKGVKSFVVSVEECHDELINLFINGCGFRQCSSEVLWKNDKPQPQKSNLRWRVAQNSDSKKIAQLYNDEIIPMFKPSLSRNHKEFQTPLFEGMTDFYKTRYIYEDCGKVLGYYSITTSDNINYIYDITLNSGYDFDYDDIINKLLCETALKKRAFYPFIKQKKYMKNSEKLEEYLKSHGYNYVQTCHILVKDFYKPVTQETKEWKVFVLGEGSLS